MKAAIPTSLNVLDYLTFIYKISKLLFQISNASYFFPFIDWQLSCPHVERNNVQRCCVRCVNMMGIVVLD